MNANTRLHDEFFLIHLAIAIHDLIQYTMAISNRSLSNSDCYDDSSPLDWTVEVCPSCHYKVDEKNRKRINMYYARKELLV